MRIRREPTLAKKLLQLFCSAPQHEALIGDLLEQYQRGRGRWWYTRQVVGVVLLALYRKVNALSLSLNANVPGQAVALALLLAGLSAVLLSDIWPLFVVGIVAGGVVGILKSCTHPAASAQSQAKALPPMHPGISIHRIPVEGGAAGLLFVIGVVLTFAGGIGQVRELLVLTIPSGILMSVVLVRWHREHRLKFQTLHLHEEQNR
jgi:hypothetical protein